MSEPRKVRPMDIGQIEELLPHRYPFLMIDRVTDHEPGDWAKGVKCVSANEAYFTGHFPQKKVMPGALIIEALAQMGAIAILTAPEDRGKLALFSGIRQARFLKSVVPGDVIDLDCRITRRRGPIGMGIGIARVNGETVCDAELIFALQS